MKFLVFAGECYYPGGGWDDFVDHYDTKEEAVADARAWETDRGKHAEVWWHVVDVKEDKIVSKSDDE